MLARLLVCASRLSCSTGPKTCHSNLDSVQAIHELLDDSKSRDASVVNVWESVQGVTVDLGEEAAKS